MGTRPGWLVVASVVLVTGGACGSGSEDEPTHAGPQVSGGASGLSGVTCDAGEVGIGPGQGGAGSLGDPGGAGARAIEQGGATAGGSGGEGNNGPLTCEQAAMTRSSLGCEFWPTLVANPVWLEF